MKGPIRRKMVMGTLIPEVIKLVDINKDLVRQWTALSRRVNDPNLYLAPEFVLSATKHLASDKIFYLVVVWNNEGHNSLSGVAIFSLFPGDRHFPLPQVVLFSSTHSFLGGILLEDNDAENVFSCMLGAVKKRFPLHFGMRLHSIGIHSKLGDSLVSQKKDSDVKWFEIDRLQRAILLRKQLEEQDSGDAHLSSKRRKNFRRLLKKLEEDHGRIEWRIIHGKDVSEEHIDTFLRLENSGWKGKNGTSLLKNKNETQFFKEVIAASRENDEVFFTELVVNSEVIASTCNFIIGRYGFAFKIGWNVEFRDYSPGIINEVMFLNNIEALAFDEIDSGADESSFITDYWPGRKTLVSGVVTFGFLPKIIMEFIIFLKRIKRRFGHD